MSHRIITLLSDFGLQDGYVASMKGVILSICPDVQLVDISHMIPPQDIRAGAFILGAVYGDFPPGTIHLAVVDPGVGTNRRAIAIETPSCFFVGPDNGIFSWALLRENHVETRSLENPQYFQPAISNTFHGRDIFAPVAAHLARGAEFGLLGPPCQPYAAQWTTPVRTAEGVCGEVIHIDRFGNAITNLDRETLASFAVPDAWTVHVRDAVTCKTAHAYADGEPGDLVALLGSSGCLEIAVNQGNAARTFGIRTGDPVSAIRRLTPPSSVSPLV